MSGLHLKLRAQPPGDCDASALGLQLQQLSAAQVRDLPLRYLGSKRAVSVGECFDVSPRLDRRVVIEGDLQRLHGIGTGWSGEELVVEGNVGESFGSQMRAGRLRLRGDAAGGAAEQMYGGELRIDGRAGDHLGRPLPGRRSGIRGGRVVVAGRCGHWPAYRMRRGMLLLLGGCGDCLGCDLVAGTLVVAGSVGAHVAAGMRRGTIVLPASAQLSQVRFSEPVSERLGITRLLASDLMPEAKHIAAALQTSVNRALGDLTAGGMGEVWLYQS